MILMRLLLPVILAAVVSAGPLPLRWDASKRGTPPTIASAWFGGWHAAPGSNPIFPVENVSYSKYTHLMYAFATTTPDVNVLGFSQADQIIMPQFVNLAHNNQVSVSISIGGWEGSRYFSSAVATAENRTAFVKTLATFASNYSVQGLDFDWEFPNRQTGCNLVSPNDTKNFLLLLQELRNTSSTTSLALSASTSIHPFLNESMAPSTDVSEFATVLDFIQIMDYDVWGPFSDTVGPNAPLDDSCAPPGHQNGSAISAVAAWTKAGFPANKIVLGTPGYGHGFRVRKDAAYESPGILALYPPFNKTDPPSGDSWDSAAGNDQCGIFQPVGGVFQFWGLVNNGFLDTAGNPSSGIDYRFDNCSKTTYVYNQTTEVLVSFDDATAISAKGEYIKSAGLAGFAIWEAGSDYQDILLNAISGAT